LFSSQLTVTGKALSGCKNAFWALAGSINRKLAAIAMADNNHALIREWA
jgi:hypothetical protein